MGIDEKRKRCMVCKYCRYIGCPLMCNADVLQIDNCIIEDLRFKQIKEGTPE